VVAIARDASPANKATKRGIPRLYLITTLESKRIYMKLWKISPNLSSICHVTLISL